MFYRRILISACLLGGELWYGTAAASERIEPPELSFDPMPDTEMPLLQGSDHLSDDVERVVIEPSSRALELPPAIFETSFDPRVQWEVLQPMRRSLAERLWAEPRVAVRAASPAPPDRVS